jgi:hypothetical protein
MKYGFAIPTLFVVLGASLYAQHAFSQAPSLPVLDPSGLFDGDTGLPSGIQEQISVEQVPSIPQPGEQVSVRVTGYSTDLNKARITWTLDGRAVVSQTGATTFTFQAPASGQTSRLVITIAKEGGGTITRTITISPADVDLLYEAETYAHPFYKGKRLFTSESAIRFIAVPHFTNSNGAKIDSSNLVYTWRMNGSVQQNASGYGRNTFSVKGSLIERPMQVTVEVSAANSTLKATQSISLQSTQPEITLYENNPLLGVVYEKAIQGTFLLERPQVDFEGIPYFFSGTYKDDVALDYNWYINGTEVMTKEPNENYMVLRNDKNQEGTAVINVALSSVSNLLQNAKSSLELNFKQVDNESNEQFTF